MGALGVEGGLTDLQKGKPDCLDAGSTEQQSQRP